MTSVDPWEKAADCERSLQTVIDPERRAVLGKLRDLWIALANTKTLLTDGEMAKDIEVLNRMQVQLTAFAFNYARSAESLSLPTRAEISQIGQG
jgi:hypothetical protein